MTSIAPLAAATGCDCGAQDPKGLLSVDAALAKIDAVVRAVEGAEAVPLVKARGRVLAAPVRVTGAVPPFDNSAMDGYALDPAGLPGAGPWVLPVTGRVLAGQAPVDPCHGAVQVFTGAPIPPGATAVIAQEDVERLGNSIHLHRLPRPGENIRRAGSDMAARAVILEAGTRVGPAEIAILAAAGQGTPTVLRRIRVAVLVTGDELRDADAALSPGAIRDVNGPLLGALLDRPEVVLLPPERVADDPSTIADRLARLSEIADLVVTTGGVSVGAADHLRPVLEHLGGRLHFAGVAMKPGKPVAHGTLGQSVWLGLPGNPLAVLTGWALFGTRILERLTGARCATVSRRRVVADVALSHRPGRCEFRPARLVGPDGQGREVIRFPANTQSHRVSDLVDFDGFACLPAEIASVPPGGWIEFLPFRF
ncbi:MAG: molybdopterin molybdotransferase MoeA [Paracoccaceae bacterium]|nr:molybdopterin molybdotransferase MoeA [Paracoccaceae bacterium]